MYAIKIISGKLTHFYLADEISYEHVKYSNNTEFWSHIDKNKPDYQIGDSPSENVNEGWYVDMWIDYDDAKLSKEMFVMPEATIYIMQNGNTIEVIKVQY